MAELFCHQLDQGLTDQTRLARTGDSGDRREDAQGKGDIEVIEVIACDSFQPQPSLRRTDNAAGEFLATKKISSSLRFLDPL